MSGTTTSTTSGRPVPEAAYGVRSQAVGLAVIALSCFAASAVGGLFTATSVESWYQQLTRPSWTPPDWVFGPVWTLLYATMAVAAWLVWRANGGRARRRALAVFAVQLALNALWSALFFGLRSPGAGLVGIVALFVAIATTIIAFTHVSRTAAVLLGPYLAWVGFASYLNATIWWLN